ncbi:crotonobetainyl-CoA:carnitine CoA-transferase CaiB-like acyl-CoA transferase [Variovorax boronicumulans]|uniref:CaiB/BaiF CoA transferase family protein n=1 Tax=Variovorax boronicumulans TaxID=436515 RepID=UPI002788FB70|nr:CoA transferase [Variovorax boronicumulans]MDP9912501.1 crotonobetainyl-CoA:carnitine CoA-transferase CaiB-like acyl-CoA transferase [Variovorax boronicumulans]
MSGASVQPPLAGITVVDFSELLPGPFFTQSLAELGARVIKIERPPHGDNVRRMGPGVFEAVNRGKQSLLADLKDEAQRAQVRALIATADVLVESYRPGVMARLGLDAASLRADFPRLVYVSLSGYGQTGPWADLPGHDINYLAAAGVLAVSGVPDGGPAQSFGLPVADLCGAMYALSSTLAALYQREHTGQGQHLDVALADCALHWMNPRVGAWREAGAVSLATQREAALVKAAYGAFACRDGRHVSIAALEDHFWARLCEAIDLAPYGGEAFRAMKARKAVAGAINVRIAEVLADRDADEVFALLQQHDVPAAPVVEPSRVAALAQFAQRNKFEAANVLPVARYPVPMAGVVPGRLGGAPVLDSARN